MRVPIVILYRRGNRFACPLHSAALYISNSNYVSRVPLNLKACVSFWAFWICADNILLHGNQRIEQAICDYSGSDTSKFKECLLPTRYENLSKDKFESGLAQQKAVPSLKYGFHFAGQRDTSWESAESQEYDDSLRETRPIVARYASLT